MIRSIKNIFFILILFVPCLGFSQNQAGLNLIPRQLYQALPQGINPLRNTGALPPYADIGSSLLTSLSQGSLAACASWATAFEVTRIERIRNRWPNTERYMFSPSYLYNMVNGGRDNGSSFLDNLTLLVNRGCSTYLTFPYTLDFRLQPGPEAHAEAAKYKIAEWRKIDRDVTVFKAWLAGGYGIICSFKIWENFDRYKGGIYRPAGAAGVIRNNRDGARSPYHGGLIVGYSDERRCFKVINSWGGKLGRKWFLVF
jgi:C1A family cysteine protease